MDCYVSWIGNGIKYNIPTVTLDQTWNCTLTYGLLHIGWGENNASNKLYQFKQIQYKLLILSALANTSNHLGNVRGT